MLNSLYYHELNKTNQRNILMIQNRITLIYIYAKYCLGPCPRRDSSLFCVDILKWRSQARLIHIRISK